MVDAARLAQSRTVGVDRFSAPVRPRPTTFSLLLPARHEQDVLADTIHALTQLDHPAYEVMLAAAAMTTRKPNALGVQRRRAIEALSGW